MSFVFGRITPDGALAWYATGPANGLPPRYVRLILRDRQSGVDLLGEAAFVVRADAPASCGRAEADPACLSVAPSLPIDTLNREGRRDDRSDPRRGMVLVAVLWSISLLSALAMAASSHSGALPASWWWSAIACRRMHC